MIPGGDFEKRCLAAGGRAVGEGERLVIYDMRPTTGISQPVSGD